MSCKEALFLVAKMLQLTHDNESDKNYAVELSWITDETKHKHQKVPEDLYNKAMEEAKASIE